MIAVGVALLFVPLWPTTVALILVLLAYQQVENYLIGPRILGRSVELSPAAVLLATLLGAPPDRPRQQHPRPSAAPVDATTVAPPQGIDVPAAA